MMSMAVMIFFHYLHTAECFHLDAIYGIASHLMVSQRLASWVEISFWAFFIFPENSLPSKKSKKNIF